MFVLMCNLNVKISIGHCHSAAEAPTLCVDGNHCRWSLLWAEITSCNAADCSRAKGVSEGNWHTSVSFTLISCPVNDNAKS